MNKPFIITSAMLILIFTISCNRDIVYEQYAEITDNLWDTDDIKQFDVPIQDTLHAFDVFIMLRNNGQYPWRNIHMFVSTTSPLQQQVKDSVEYYLADEMGKWKGSGWGNIFTHRLPYRLNVKFPYKGIYRFEIQHGMRNEELPGIMDVGILVKRHKMKK